MILFLTLAAGVTGSPVYAAPPKLSARARRITVGKSATLKLKNASKKGKWKVSDRSVLKIVKKSGKRCVVKGLKKGSASLICKVGKKTLKCKITVEKPSVSTGKIKLHKGRYYELKIKGTGGTPTFSYTAHTVVKVTKKSKYVLKVKGMKEGSSVITLVINKKKYKVKVTVSNHFPASSWTRKKDPTTEEDGLDVKLCTECGKVAEKKAVPRLPSVSYRQIGNVNSRMQDGAVYGDYLVTCHSSGIYGIYDVHTLALISLVNEEEHPFMRPHCNSVCFGPDFYAPDDPFPLLYCNVYNKYSASATDKREGICLVYRLVPENGEFTAYLVQIIRIGFVEDREYWKSLEGAGDLRPFGNFVINPADRTLIAYVPRDKNTRMRYFVFHLPPAPSWKDETGEDEGGPDDSGSAESGPVSGPPDGSESLGDDDTSGEGPFPETPSSPGEPNKAGIPEYTLLIEDILEMHDSTYLKVIQGNCLADNKLYVLAGLSTVANPATLGVIDLNDWSTKVIDLRRDGLSEEPELIYTRNSSLYYGTYSGAVYRLRLLV